MSFLLVFLNVSGTDCMQYTLRQQHLLHTREMFTTQNNNNKKKKYIPHISTSEKRPHLLLYLF